MFIAMASTNLLFSSVGATYKHSAPTELDSLIDTVSYKHSAPTELISKQPLSTRTQYSSHITHHYFYGSIEAH
jgi:hypothetical protein